jgi:hypothetical protein
MTFPSSTNNATLGASLSQLQSYVASIKNTAAAAVIVLAGNTINTAYVFATLDQLSGVIANLNSYSNIVGLNAYATANIPGYAGTLTTDIAAVIAAAQACINWVVTNFPTDTTTHTWILAYKLNADGTRVMATFSPAQTAGFQTALNALVATIS